MDSIELSFDIDAERLSKALQEAKEIGIEGEKEFFDNAYTLFEWAITEIRNGGIITAIYKDKKKIIEAVLPFMTKKNRRLQ